MEQVSQQIHQFISSAAERPGLASDDEIFESGLVNSLFAMQLVLFAEETFGIVVEGEDLDMLNFSSVDAMTRFVTTKLSL